MAYTIPTNQPPVVPAPKPEYKKYVIAFLLGLLAAVMSLNATYGHFGFKISAVMIIFFYTWFIFSATVLEVGLRSFLLPVIGLATGLVVFATIYDLMYPAYIIPKEAYSIFYLFPMTVALTWIVGIMCPLVLLKRFAERNAALHGFDLEGNVLPHHKPKSENLK